jgi:hypothetical protein
MLEVAGEAGTARIFQAAREACLFTESSQKAYHNGEDATGE